MYIKSFHYHEEDFTALYTKLSIKEDLPSTPYPPYDCNHVIIINMMMLSWNIVQIKSGLISQYVRLWPEMPNKMENRLSEDAVHIKWHARVYVYPDGCKALLTTGHCQWTLGTEIKVNCPQHLPGLGARQYPSAAIITITERISNPNKVLQS